MVYQMIHHKINRFSVVISFRGLRRGREGWGVRGVTMQLFEITYIFVIKSELIRLHYINVVEGNYVMHFCDV